MFNSKLMKNFLVAAALIVALPAAAQIDTWDLTTGVKSSNTTLFDSMSVSGLLNNNSLTITGWSDTGTGATIETGQLKYDSSYGLQLVNNDEGVNDNPGHSIDSYDGDFDMVLLSFDTKVDLTEFSLGWAKEGNNNNRLRSDVSVVAFTGLGGGNSNISGDTWGDVASSGDWSTVGRYNNVDDYNYQTVTSQVESKYWLIGAYNSIFANPGETILNGQNNLTNGNDGFKLAGVKGETSVPPPSIPEPTSFAILGLGMLALLFSNRKNSKVNHYM